MSIKYRSENDLSATEIVHKIQVCDLCPRFVLLFFKVREG